MFAMFARWTYLFVISVIFFFFKQKTAYELRISDWSSDVCSSDLDNHWTLLPAAEDEHVGSTVLLVGDEPLPHGFDSRLAGLGVETRRWWGGGIHEQRSEERRVGKECVSTCRSRWSPYH